MSGNTCAQKSASCELKCATRAPATRAPSRVYDGAFKATSAQLSVHGENPQRYLQLYFTDVGDLREGGNQPVDDEAGGGHGPYGQHDPGNQQALDPDHDECRWEGVKVVCNCGLLCGSI